MGNAQFGLFWDWEVNDSFEVVSAIGAGHRLLKWLTFGVGRLFPLNFRLRLHREHFGLTIIL